MINRILTSLIVGAYHRPPAKVLLDNLPSGTPLGLQPEPDNAYDPNALKVMLDPKDIPESQHSALANPHSGLESQGATLEQVLSSGPIQLGYVARSGGQPLVKAMNASGGALSLVGNGEFLEVMALEDLELNDAKLSFGPSGEPLINLRVDEEEEEPAESDWPIESALEEEELEDEEDLED